MNVIKKDGTKENFNKQKIIVAVGKSAERAMVKLSTKDNEQIIENVLNIITNLGIEDIPISTMHYAVETALEKVSPSVATSYRNYRNYKQDFVKMLDEVYKKAQSIMYIGDKDNANSDSALVPTILFEYGGTSGL